MFCSISLDLKKSDIIIYIMQIFVVHSGYFEYKNSSDGFLKAEIWREDKIV